MSPSRPFGNSTSGKSPVFNAESMAILTPLIVAMGVTVFTILNHALAVWSVLHFVRRELRVGYAGTRFWTDVPIVAGVVLLALIAHVVDICMWALTLVVCGEFSQFAPAFYASAANYTSLGDSSSVISPSWKLLAPLETGNGLLMFGISTAMIFAVIQRLTQTRFDKEDKMPRSA